MKQQKKNKIRSKGVELVKISATEISDGVITLPGLSGIRVPSTKGDPVKTKEWWQEYSKEVLSDLCGTAMDYGYNVEDFTKKVFDVWLEQEVLLKEFEESKQE